jgi:hypothetical protein
MRSLACSLAVAALLVATAVPAAARETRATSERCANGRSRDGAMWLSIAHPGLGEWSLKGWGPFERAPQKKFWLGFIPVYGWPGYLQVKSAIDAHHCRTNDRLRF